MSKVFHVDRPNIPNRQKSIKKSFQGISCVESSSLVLEDDDVNAAMIATPANFHFAQAKQALMANRHLFVEKTMATKFKELSEIAKKRT